MSNIYTWVADYEKGLATNSTDSSFASLVATVTEPTADGVISCGVANANGGLQSRNTVLIAPFGVGNADLTFSLRVTGWSKVSTLWVPVTLGEFACTLGTATGVSGASVANTDKFVDTITSVLTPDNKIIMSPADNTRAYVVLDALGFEKIQLTFDLTGATSANALVKRM